MRVAIIDDEACARNALRNLINLVCDDVTVIGEAENVSNGIKLIKESKPDLIFLDIEMPEYNGFHLLSCFSEINFEVVFMTAHSKYALEAFGVSASGYILKPMSIAALTMTIDKARGKLQSKRLSKKQNKQNTSSQKFTIPIAGGMEFLKIQNILYLKADGSYTHIYMIDGTKHLIAKKMKTFERLLEHPAMYRSHRSFLINLGHVKQFIRNEGGYIVMENNDVVSLARDKRDSFLDRIEHFM